MTSRFAVMREIGTGYLGKEPHEYNGDILRALTGLAGGELGFETCLTSRPFTSRTFVPERLGTMEPGREALAGAPRAALDLTDGLDLLQACGYGVQTACGTDAPSVDLNARLLWGPVAVAPRWCPPEDGLAFGAAWRYILVEAWGQHDVVGMDPVFGGETSVARSESVDAGLLVVKAPSLPIDRSALAFACLRRGVAWRVATNAADEAGIRDAAGLRAAAAAASSLVLAMPAERLRLALWNQGLHALRWGGMLGELVVLDTDTLALADVLTQTGRACERAERALRERDATCLRRRLEEMADLAGAITELSGRIATRPA